MTLIEVLLALALLTLLVGLAVLATGSLTAHREFREGVFRFQGLLNRARAEAGNRRRTVRLRFDVDETAPDGVPSVIVEIERDPLEAPGSFTPLEAPWARSLAKLVRLRQCVLTGDAAWRQAALTAGAADGGPGFGDTGRRDPLTFRPDGSGDAAVIELSPREEDDPRRCVLVLTALGAEADPNYLHADDLPLVYEELGIEEVAP